MSWFWILFQVFIVLWVTVEKWCLTSSKPWKRQWGYLIGITAQIWWFIIFFHCGTYWLMLTLLVDGSIWARGYFHNRQRRKYIKRLRR